MRPKKDIAKDQMDMAPYRKGGRTRRYAGGGDIENYEDAPAPKVERIGKSALEEGEEEFQRMIAQRGRRAAPASKPAPRRAPSEQMPTRMSASGVPVGEDEMVSRESAQPTARQPSTAERMIEALPAGAAGIAGAAGLGRMLSRGMLGRRIAESQQAAKARSADALRRATEARSSARRAAKEAEAGRDASRMAEEGGSMYGRGAPQPRRIDQAQRRAFVGEPSTYGYARGGSVSSASSRADGIAQKGKTKGKVI